MLFIASFVFFGDCPMRKDNPAFVPDSPFARPMTAEHM